MQTQLMHPLEKGVPWLERSVAGVETPERTPLVSLPFTIGRVEATDLQINSTRVSREHAVIVKEPRGYVIRDLGSTNGTFVNGEKIREHLLADGDALAIADCEFTFVAGEQEGRQRHMVTQVFDHADGEAAVSAADRVLAVRRLQESLLHRALLPRLRPIVDLERNIPALFEAEPLAQAWGESDLKTLAGSGSCHLVGRAQQLYRLLAVEAHAGLQTEAAVLLEVGREEARKSLETEAHLLRLAHLAGHHRVIVGLDANAVSEDEGNRQLRDRLHNAGFRLALLHFLGGKSQVLQLAEAAPEFLLLAPNLAGELRQGARQARQLQGICEACREIGARPVVTGIKSRDEEDACLRLGIELAVSERLHRPLSTSSPRQPLPGDARAECFA